MFTLMLHEYRDKTICLPESRSVGNSLVVSGTLRQSPVLAFQLQPPSKAMHSSILTPT